MSKLENAVESGNLEDVKNIVDHNPNKYSLFPVKKPTLSELEKALKYWAIGFLAVVITLIMILKRKLEHKLEDN